MGVIAKYKFNNTLADLLPEFNSEFTSDLYTVTDEVDGEVTTRTIESDSLPTLMRFGRVYISGESSTDNRTDSLLEVLDMNTSGLTSCGNMFRFCKNLTSITCEWDISNVTNIGSMFHNCNKLTTLDVSNWNTSNVTNMSNMFYACKSLTSLNVSNWNTSNVANMAYMFNNCNNLIILDVSNWDTGKVTDMQNMFNNCNKLTTLDVSNFDTSKVADMGSMFSNCQSVASLDVSNFDTSNVINMGGMFGDCYALISIEGINNFDVRKVQNFGNIFISCHTLQYLDLHNWTTSTDAQHQGMFAYCNNLHTIDISNFIFLGSSDGRKLLFYNSPNIKYIKCNNIATIDIIKSQLPTKSSTSQGTIICKSDTTNLDITSLQSKYWNIIDEPTLIAKYVFDKSIHNNCIPEFNTEFEGYFIEDEEVEGSNEVTRTIESCGMLPKDILFGERNWNSRTPKSRSLLKVTYLNLSNVTNCDRMFRWCDSLIEVNSSDWDTSKVTTMHHMFTDCARLGLLDVNNWNTSNVTNMRGMFLNCNKITTLDVSNWNTSNVTDMNSMFQSCANLTSLDLNNFDTSKVTNMSYMFYNCKNLTSLDVSNFDTSNVANMEYIFYNTPLLTDIGVLYMDKSSLQKLVNAMPTDSNKTLWYKDVNIDGITHGDNITLKKYIEENVEIVLNSPLLEGDTIEVKDSRLCHYHKMGRVVLDGSENEGWTKDANLPVFKYKIGGNTDGKYELAFCDNFPYLASTIGTLNFNCFKSQAGFLQFRHISYDTLDTFKQWLSENPTTVVYELETPYYENITNLQSAPTLKTYLECSMEIDTDLPIDTNVTYRTNLSSVYVMERELDELDNGTDLGDILEGEVNE